MRWILVRKMSVIDRNESLSNVAKISVWIHWNQHWSNVGVDQIVVVSLLYVVDNLLLTDSRQHNQVIHSLHCNHSARLSSLPCLANSLVIRPFHVTTSVFYSRIKLGACVPWYEILKRDQSGMFVALWIHQLLRETGEKKVTREKTGQLMKNRSNLLSESTSYKLLNFKQETLLVLLFDVVSPFCNQKTMLSVCSQTAGFCLGDYSFKQDTIKCGRTCSLHLHLQLPSTSTDFVLLTLKNREEESQLPFGQYDPETDCRILIFQESNKKGHTLLFDSRQKRRTTESLSVQPPSSSSTSLPAEVKKREKRDRVEVFSEMMFGAIPLAQNDSSSTKLHFIRNIENQILISKLFSFRLEYSLLPQLTAAKVLSAFVFHHSDVVVDWCSLEKNIWHRSPFRSKRLFPYEELSSLALCYDRIQDERAAEYFKALSVTLFCVSDEEEATSNLIFFCTSRRCYIDCSNKSVSTIYLWSFGYSATQETHLVRSHLSTQHQITELEPLSSRTSQTSIIG